MMILDNVNRLLGDDLKQTIKAGAKLKIAASSFSIYAFEALKKELEKIRLSRIHLHSADLCRRAGDRQIQERAPRIPYPEIGAGTRLLRQRIRNSAEEQAHPARHRQGMRRLDAAQSHLPLQPRQSRRCSNSPALAVATKAGLYAAARFHRRRSRLPTRATRSPTW